MGCCCNRQNRKLVVKLTFGREELLYDAKNIAYVEGDVLSEDAEHTRHQVFDIGEEGNVDRVTRVMNTVHAEVTEMLYPYTKKPIPVAENPVPLVDVLREPPVYVINMILPETFSLTTVHLLKQLIHEYFVDRIMADWLSIVSPGAEAKWNDKAADIKDRIETAKSSNGKGYRIKLHTF